MVQATHRSASGNRKLARLPSTAPLEAGSVSIETKNLAALRGWRTDDSSELFGTIHSLLTSEELASMEDLREDLILELLVGHHELPEALHLSCQIARAWTADFASAQSNRRALCELMSSKIASLSLSGNLAKQERDADLRHILLKAVESPVLRESATTAITAILSSNDSGLLREKRALATQLLNLIRHQSGYNDIKRLAATTFATTLGTGAQIPSNSRPSQWSTASAPGSTQQLLSERRSAQALHLIQRITGEGGAREVARLMPTDFQVLKAITGLSLETFRLVCERLRMRAVSDPWARSTLLELARAPHDSSVTSSVRTAMLGSLVSEARKIGKLSAELEKEVYATSATIPEMISPPDSSGIDSERSPDPQEANAGTTKHANT